MGRLLTWLLTAPILVVGLFAGHELGYRLAVPDPYERANELGQAGHDYFAYAPYLAAVVVSVSFVALALGIRQAIFGRRATTPSWAFALLPPLGFILLEAIERLRGGELALSTFAVPEVLAGLALQLPFAVAALVVARLLASLADAVGIALKPLVLSPLRARLLSLVPAGAALPPVRVVALPYGERGPPRS